MQPWKKEIWRMICFIVVEISGAAFLLRYFSIVTVFKTNITVSLYIILQRKPAKLFINWMLWNFWTKHRLMLIGRHGQLLLGRTWTMRNWNQSLDILAACHGSRFTRTEGDCGSSVRLRGCYYYSSGDYWRGRHGWSILGLSSPCRPCLEPILMSHLIIIGLS